MKNYIRIATLNVRSILKSSNNKTQKTYTKYLRSKSRNVDILCLQGAAHIRSNHIDEHLTSEHYRRLQLIFPDSTMILSKHCALLLCTQFTIQKYIRQEIPWDFNTAINDVQPE
jgi:hypothetical protein